MEPVPVFRANSAAQARLVQNWLEDNGIQSTLIGAEPDATGLFEVVAADPIVVVAQEDFEKAAAAIEEYSTSVRSEENLNRMTEEEGLFGWPLCPTCDELRPATCDRCKYTGSEYDVQVNDAGTRIRCMKCNEFTTIRQVDTCPYCQHLFVEDDREPAAHAPEAHANSHRVILMILGILAAIAIVAAAILFGGSDAS